MRLIADLKPAAPAAGWSSSFDAVTQMLFGASMSRCPEQHLFIALCAGTATSDSQSQASLRSAGRALPCSARDRGGI